MRDVLLLFIFFIASGNAQTVKFEAPAQVNLDNEGLLVKCAPSAGEFNFINRLEIKRKQAGESTYTTILYVEDPPRGSDPMFRDGDLEQRATAVGRAGKVSGVSLELQIPVGQVTCEDGGSYQCKIMYMGANNESLTVTSLSVAVAIVVNPPGSPPVFNLSPSNVPGTTGNVYLKGTTIVLICQAEVGSPARPMRFCHRGSDMPNFLPVPSTQADVVTPVSTDPGKICILSRTIVATFAIADNAGNFSCDVYNATVPNDPVCGTSVKNSVRSYSGQDYPFCNASNVDSTTPTTTTTTTTTSTTMMPTTTTTDSLSIEETLSAEVSGVSYSGGLTLLLLGCALISLSGIMMVVSVILYFKAKKLRKETEMSMIRSTYDSVRFNTGPGPNYSSLENLKEQAPHRKIEKLDSDGYMMPAMNTYK